MNRYFRKALAALLSLLLWPLKYVIPKENVIILQTYSPYVYCDNTKYLYEYLSTHTDYEVYWVTDSDDIQRYLDSKGLKYITKKNIFKQIFIALRSSIVIDSGSMYFNRFNLIDKRTLKITTMHGNGPQAIVSTYDTLKDNLVEIFKFNKFDFINYPSKYSGTMLGKIIYRLPHHKLISLGYPRCDQFFNRRFVNERYRNREMAKQLNEKFNRNGKIILYTPTWRPYKYDLPLLSLDDFDLIKFDCYLRENNIFFFYTTHTVNLPINVIPETDQIKYITGNAYPFFDINRFMLEVDVLLNDYSTTSTEFALLHRPQVFCMPDYEHYFQQKGFAEDYRSIIPGKEVNTLKALMETLLYSLIDPESYLNIYNEKISLLLDRYYDTSITNSCELFAQFIHKKLGES